MCYYSSGWKAHLGVESCFAKTLYEQTRLLFYASQGNNEDIQWH